MQSKLTLNIRGKELIAKVKELAKSQNKSPSVFVENALRDLVRERRVVPSKNGGSSETSKLVGVFNKNREVVSDPQWELLKEKYKL